MAPIWLLRVPTSATPSFTACRRVFFLFHFLQELYFPNVFLLWVFVQQYHVRACCQLFTCIAVLQAQHSTAQSARTKPQRKYVSIRVRKQHTESTYCISTASTAQHSAISPHKAAKQVRTDQSATTQASRQIWELARSVRDVILEHGSFWIVISLHLKAWTFLSASFAFCSVLPVTPAKWSAFGITAVFTAVLTSYSQPIRRIHRLRFRPKGSCSSSGSG